MRAAACDPIPTVVCGAPRSHLLSSMLAVQRLAGGSRDPSSMACAAAAYTAPCTWPGHAGGGGACSASKAAYVLERSCSTGARVPDHAWMACRGAWFSSSRCGAACWPKFWGSEERAGRASMGGLGWYYVHAEGSGATSQARGQVTDTRGSHNDATLAS